MIHFAQKPGLFSYRVRHSDFVKLAGRSIVRENREITGYGRFQPANLAAMWETPFLKVFKDGDHMCALVGDNLQEGTAEFAPLTGANLYDQITDLMHAYGRAHPGFKWSDRCDYWEPHEIEFMAEQARARAA